MGLAEALMTSNHLRGFVTIHFGHMAIHQNDVITDSIQGFEDLAAIGDGIRVEAEFLQLPQSDLLVDDIVLGNQNAKALRARGGDLGRGWSAGDRKSWREPWPWR